MRLVLLKQCSQGPTDDNGIVELIHSTRERTGSTSDVSWRNYLTVEIADVGSTAVTIELSQSGRLLPMRGDSVPATIYAHLG